MALTQVFVMQPSVARNPIRKMLRQIVDDQRVRDLPDAELLRRFRAEQDEAAFHALVQRHGAIVFDVCRGVLRTDADAEDAFQATFLVLARKAGSIRKTGSLSAWLHGVAYRTALKARRQNATRQDREGRVPERSVTNPDDLTWREVRQVLHEEVNGLAERYRTPLILCYLEGKSQDEAAAQLGLPKGTLKGHLDRARKLLQARLVRRGLGPAALLLSVALPLGTASASVPTDLVLSTVQATHAFVAGQASTGIVSARVAELTSGVLKAMLVKKFKVASTVLLTLMAAGVGVMVLFAQTIAAQPTDKKPITPTEQTTSSKASRPLDARTNLLTYKDAGRDMPVRTAADWEKRRTQILEEMQLVMGPLPDASTKVPFDLRIDKEEDLGAIVRKKISIAVAKDERVGGYLLMPKEVKGKVAGILCPHQTNGPQGSQETAGLAGLENLHQAKHLAERGYVCLTLDYPGYGAYRPFDLAKTGFKSGVMKGIWNNMCAIDALQSLPQVDTKKIGCIGHSLGGHVTMFTAAFEPRITAVVSNCGFTSFPKYANGNLNRWATDLMMPRIATMYESDAAKMPFDFPEVVATFAPRPFLAVSPTKDDFDVTGVKDCLTSAQRVYDLLGVSERLASYHPEHAHHFAAGGRRTAYAFLDRWLK